MSEVFKGLGGRDLALIIMVCVFWAVNFLLAVYSMREIPPFLFTALRMMMVALILVWFIKIPPKNQWVRLVAVGILNGALHFGLNFLALEMAGNLTAPSIAAQSYLPITLILAWVFLGERFDVRTGVMIFIGFLGVMVLSFDPLSMQNPMAVGLVIIAHLALALGTILMRGLSGINMANQQGWTAIISIIPLLLMSVVFEPGGISGLVDATWIGWGGALFAAIFGSILGHGVLYVLIKRHTVSKVTPYLLMAPVMTVILGVIFLGDRPGIAMVIGGLMVLGGVFGITIRTATRITQSGRA